MNTPRDKLHTIDTWYDGPVDGIADYRGSPHYYQATYLAPSSQCREAPLFHLVPVSQALLARALEMQEMYERWRKAHDAGTAPDGPDDPLILPGDLARHQQLAQQVQEELSANVAEPLLVRGEFEDGGTHVVWQIVAPGGVDQTGPTT